jgi:hypothetical protein
MLMHLAMPCTDVGRHSPTCVSTCLCCTALGGSAPWEGIGSFYGNIGHPGANPFAQKIRLRHFPTIPPFQTHSPMGFAQVVYQIGTAVWRGAPSSKNKVPAYIDNAQKVWYIIIMAQSELCSLLSESQHQQMALVRQFIEAQHRQEQAALTQAPNGDDRRESSQAQDAV